MVCARASFSDRPTDQSWLFAPRRKVAIAQMLVLARATRCVYFEKQHTHTQFFVRGRMHLPTYAKEGELMYFNWYIWLEGVDGRACPIYLL